MIRGLYASASAMVADVLRQDMVANNIANATTPGFSRDCIRFESFPHVLLQACDRGDLLGRIAQGSRASGIYVDGGKGPAQRTGASADVFIRGNGYFVIQDGERTVYTRHGSFIAGPGNMLTTQKGHRVMGSAGPISVKPGVLSIDSRGYVMCDNETVGRLKVVEFTEPVQMVKNENGYLTPVRIGAGGDALLPGMFPDQWYTEPGPVPSTLAEPELEPGTLEMSNVNPVMEMVSLITVLRSYEANAKAIQAQDETLARAVNDLAG